MVKWEWVLIGAVLGHLLARVYFLCRRWREHADRLDALEAKVAVLRGYPFNEEA